MSMQGFMQTATCVETEAPAAVIIAKPKRAFKASLHRTSLNALITALPKLNKHFTSEQVATLLGAGRNTGCRQITRLVDLGLAERCGFNGCTPLFHLTDSVKSTVLKLKATPQPYSQLTMVERKAVKLETITADYLIQLKKVHGVFTSVDLRNALGCKASTSVKRINAMLRLKLIEPYEPEKWKSGQPKTYVEKAVNV